MRKAVFIVFCVLTACTSMNDIMAPWVGKPESLMLSQWGAPDRSIKTDDGKKVMTWIVRNGYNEPLCDATFTVNKGVIIKKSTTCSNWQ